MTQATERWSVATRMIVGHDGTVAVAAPQYRGRATNGTANTANDVYTVIPSNGTPFRVELSGSQALLLIHAAEFYVRDTEEDEPLLQVHRPR